MSIFSSSIKKVLEGKAVFIFTSAKKLNERPSPSLSNLGWLVEKRSPVRLTKAESNY